jgi:hypothetical protein
VGGGGCGVCVCRGDGGGGLWLAVCGVSDRAGVEAGR